MCSSSSSSKRNGDSKHIADDWSSMSIMVVEVVVMVARMVVIAV